jgi:hypothetical protein
MWGRALVPSAVLRDRCCAAWYEKMIEAREIFAPVYAKSLYTAELRASAYWPTLARMMKLPESQ